MNGYFNIVTNPGGTFIHLIPEKDGGERISAAEVLEYLDKQKIKFEIKKITEGIAKHDEVLIQLNSDSRPPIRESSKIRVSQDKMSATIRFYPPSNGGELMSREEILGDLQRQGVRFGIVVDEIEDFLRDREYCRDYLAAQGKEPVPGTDAEIEYFFNTDLKARPTLNEDGSVDFFHLNILNHCKQGDILAKWTPEKQGMPGLTVSGERLLPVAVKRKNLRYGRNIEVSEDKTTLTSMVNGHVALVDGRVLVSDIYEVENVDNSTGNIEYEGSVRVRGNVCDNFQVVAKGDIQVDGVVEGAYLEAGGNIIIGRGMNGMDHGVLKARGNIIAKFLENTTVTASGYVEAEAILYSHVMAGGEVHVQGKKAMITGGNISAAKEVSAKVLGSPMATTTTIEVGIDPELKEHIMEVRKEIHDLQESLRKIDPVVEASMKKLRQGVRIAPEQMEYIKSILQQSKDEHARLDESFKEAEVLEIQLDEEADSSIVVQDVVYPGTQLIISGASLMIKKEYKYCRFRKIEGDVKSVPM